MKKIYITLLVLVVIGIGGYVVYQNSSTKIPELPVITPAAASAGPEWVKNMKDTFHITATRVELPYIYVDYANMPPSGVNIVKKETGEVIWRQTLTTTDSLSGSVTITLPNGIAKSPAYFGQYILQAFGPDNYIYATSVSFSIGEVETTPSVANNAGPSVNLSVQTNVEPNEVREGEIATISWSSIGATGCYLSSPTEKRNEIGTSGSSKGSIRSILLPAKITCYDGKGKEVSSNLDVTIKL
jgi:hypothetical protein